MADITISHFSTGTATVASNGTVVTFQGAGNIGSAVRAGDLFGTHVGSAVVGTGNHELASAIGVGFRSLGATSVLCSARVNPGVSFTNQNVSLKLSAVGRWS